MIACSALFWLLNALGQVVNKLHTARGDKMESAELEAVSTCFQLEHNKMMMWVPLFGLPKSHFSKFVLDFCSRGVDSEVCHCPQTRTKSIVGQ